MASDMPTERASQERQEIINRAAALTQQVDKLQKSLIVSEAQFKRLKRITIASIAIGVVVALVTVAVVVLMYRSRTYTACLSNWADEYTARADQLSRLNTVRTDELDTLVRTLDLPNPKQRAVAFEDALHKYLVASDTYTVYLKQHPAPQSPKLKC